MESTSLPAPPAYDVKKSVRFSTECPVCHEKLKFGIELHVLKSLSQYPFTHLIVHGDPLHVLIAYIDANFAVRGTEVCTDFAFAKSGEVFSALLNKWSNPF